MSKNHDVKYKCPYCGYVFDMTVYDAVNVQQDPDLRDRCVYGEIFQQECPHCHKQFLVQNDLLYEDPIHKFAIWVCAHDFGKMDIRAFTKPLVQKGYVLRRCATVKEFAEKIQILEDGVNDVMVELAKYDCFIEFVDNKKGKPEDITSIEYQRTENDVMHINVKTGDKGMAFMIPTAMLEEEMNQKPERYKVDDSEMPLVNADWMVSLFMSPAGRA